MSLWQRCEPTGTKPEPKRAEKAVDVYLICFFAISNVINSEAIFNVAASKKIRKRNKEAIFGKVSPIV